ncbi:uncharacterized protein MKZ38_002680 [Zalerion maritima]|uniref:BAHD acyltransferase n=1 Tax=Zalerion maritima TaxID=339359 RepID=A0AAD5RNM0_9PEZI|nr:uncharacterized protein MKZ38_002680 [Zalerion maritima]
MKFHQLTPVDRSVSRGWVRRAFIFPGPDAGDEATMFLNCSKIKRAFEITLARYIYLGGAFVVYKDVFYTTQIDLLRETNEPFHAGEQLPLAQRSFPNVDFSFLCDTSMPVSALPASKVGCVMDTDVHGNQPVCLDVAHIDGGVILGFSFQHSVADGSTIYNFVSAFATALRTGGIPSAWATGKGASKVEPFVNPDWTRYVQPLTRHSPTPNTEMVLYLDALNRYQVATSNQLEESAGSPEGSGGFREWDFNPINPTQPNQTGDPVMYTCKVFCLSNKVLQKMKAEINGETQIGDDDHDRGHDVDDDSEGYFPMEAKKAEDLQNTLNCIRAEMGHGRSNLRVSTQDVISAIVWISVMRARLPRLVGMTNQEGRDLNVLSSFMTAVNSRGKLEPPLPPEFMGNMITVMKVSMPLDGLFGPMGALEHLANSSITEPITLDTLRLVSRCIRDHLIDIDHSYVTRRLRYLDSLANPRLAGLALSRARQASTFGVDFASLATFGADLDFGDFEPPRPEPVVPEPGSGKPTCIRKIFAGGEGTVNVLPRRGGTKGPADWEIQVSLREEDMENFKDVMIPNGVVKGVSMEECARDVDWSGGLYLGDMLAEGIAVNN